MNLSEDTSDRKNIKAAIYARVSTLVQMQHGLGITGQIETCKKLCEMKNYDVVKIYSDKGISGTVEGHDRDEFNKLLEDAKIGNFDVIVFYKLDRLGRKLSVIIHIIEELVKFKVKPIFVEDNIDTTTDEGMFMFNILASVSDHELKVIKGRLNNGYKNRKMLDGEIGGRLPYGYCRIDKKICVNNKHVPIIKYIFDCREKGISTNVIADALNNNTIETPSGKGKWHRKTISRILNNKNKYSGHELINNNQNEVYWLKII
jgi:site-specific DNA recombinase